MKRLYTTFVLCFLLIFNFPVSAEEIEPSTVLTYHGESENWVGDFTIEISEDRITRLGEIKYKGEDLDSVGQVTYMFKTAFGKTTSKSLLAGLDSPYSPIGEKGTASTKVISGHGSNSYSKIEVVRLSVKWDGGTESFNLYK